MKLSLLVRNLPGSALAAHSQYTMKLLSRFGALCLALSLFACGGAEPRAKSPKKPIGLQMEETGAAPPIENVQMPITQLERSDVVAAVDAGLGRFLGGFSMEASLSEEGQFRGFRIVEIRDKAKFRGLGLGTGDVITAINEMPIERPAQAYAAFVGLKSAESLEVTYLRGDREMRLSLPIVGKAPAAPKKEVKSSKVAKAAKAAPKTEAKVESAKAPEKKK